MRDYHDRPRRGSWLGLGISGLGMLGIIAWRLLETGGWALTAAMVGCVLAGLNPVELVLR